MATNRFGEVSQRITPLHPAGLGDRQEPGRGHFPLGAAIPEDNFAQLHGDAQCSFRGIVRGFDAGMLDEREQFAAVLE